MPPPTDDPVLRSGVPAEVVVDRASQEWEAGATGNPLDRAQSWLALQAFGATGSVLMDLTDALVASQLDAGCRERSAFYIGGPDEASSWASPALTTAHATVALHRAGRA